VSIGLFCDIRGLVDWLPGLKVAVKKELLFEPCIVLLEVVEPTPDWPKNPPLGLLKKAFCMFGLCDPPVAPFGVKLLPVVEIWFKPTFWLNFAKGLFGADWGNLPAELESRKDVRPVGLDLFQGAKLSK